MHSFGEMLAHPHTDASGMVFDDAPAANPLKGVASPLRFNGERIGPRQRPPQRAEHTGAVLRDAGYSDDEIAALAASGVQLRGLRGQIPVSDPGI